VVKTVEDAMRHLLGDENALEGKGAGAMFLDTYYDMLKKSSEMGCMEAMAKDLSNIALWYRRGM
jgi:hypothetical protein